MDPKIVAKLVADEVDPKLVWKPNTVGKLVADRMESMDSAKATDTKSYNGKLSLDADPMIIEELSEGLSVPAD